MNSNTLEKVVDWDKLPSIQRKSILFEKFNFIKSSIQFSSNKAKILTVTSSVKGEGKSFNSMNLAASYAIQGEKVLIIDADMHNPALTKQFKKEREPGLSNVLSGRYEINDVLQKTSLDNLSFISSGTIPPSPNKLLSSDLFVNFIEQIRDLFTIIIFDTPPILLISDARIIGSKSDNVVLVIKAGLTKKRDISRSIQLIESSGKNFLGVIYNGKRLSKKESKLYHYY